MDDIHNHLRERERERSEEHNSKERREKIKSDREASTNRGIVQASAKEKQIMVIVVAELYTLCDFLSASLHYELLMPKLSSHRLHLPSCCVNTLQTTLEPKKLQNHLVHYTPAFSPAEDFA